MIRQALLIAVLLAAPASLSAQIQQARQPTASTERRICRAADTIGTRLGRIVRCQTQAEWDQSSRENGQVIHRMQRVAPPCQPWARC